MLIVLLTASLSCPDSSGPNGHSSGRPRGAGGTIALTKGESNALGWQADFVDINRYLIDAYLASRGRTNAGLNTEVRGT